VWTRVVKVFRSFVVLKGLSRMLMQRSASTQYINCRSNDVLPLCKQPLVLETCMQAQGLSALGYTW
jgi:hypothetical protein